jgi:hypothetical protein
MAKTHFSAIRSEDSELRNGRGCRHTVNPDPAVSRLLNPYSKNFAELQTFLLIFRHEVLTTGLACVRISPDGLPVSKTPVKEFLMVGEDFS